ncbi:hypothetical protein MCEMAEM6B_02761 [Mycobacteriaceae bacterium]
MPAFGFSAVPLPTKNRKILPGCHAPSAAAPGVATADPINDLAAGVAGSPLLTAAAGAAMCAAPPSSRRLAAATVHANGTAAGESPLPPAPSHANRLPLTPRTPPAAARGVALITGAAAAAGDATPTTGDTTPTAGAGEPSLTAAAESTSGTAKSTDESDDGTATEPGPTPAAPATPGTTKLGRG